MEDSTSIAAILAAIVTSGVAVTLKIRNSKKVADSSRSAMKNTQSSGNVHLTGDGNSTVVHVHNPSQPTLQQPVPKDVLVANAKQKTFILFVDDDTKFSIIEVLRREGWQTKIVRDLRRLDDQDLLRADIVFVDIHGVGKSLSRDEGLGLVVAIKEKHPAKHVVIYSAQTEGEMFHAGWDRADRRIKKNAEPYQFLLLVEDLALKRPT